MDIAQPAMSAMLKKLEEELHAELFDRSANRIHLNPTGEIALIHVNNIPFLPDRVFLPVPSDSRLAGQESVSLHDIPAQPLLYPQIGGYFLSQLDKIISENPLPITLVKNEYNITQHLVRTTNFLVTILFAGTALND